MMMPDALVLDQLPDSIGLDELRTTLADRGDVARARLALKTMIRRFPDLALQESSVLLKDQRASAELRSTAAIELGRHYDATAEAILLDALAWAPPATIRHVARSIGQIGGEAALQRLGGLSQLRENDV